MYGAILGDIIGSPYEFDRGGKTKEFPLFSENSEFTDDTVMTIAVAEAFLDMRMGEDDEVTFDSLVYYLREWGRKSPKPYGSFGNGSAMRVSPVAWLFDDLDMVRRMARLSASVTHDHPEGLKGAEATASAIFLARTGSSKGEIKAFIEENFHYDLSRTCDEIRPGYSHVESCQETVPEAITAFLEGEDFVDVIRTAVSLGGDCDTLTAIAGSIAEAFYGVPEVLKSACRKRLPGEMLAVLERFAEKSGQISADVVK